MDRRRWWLLLGGIVAVGLALRILGARGGLWLDEAASAIQAHDTGTPMGVFLKINHDNNPHINSLWMQWVGLDAPPMLARALSIVTSTVAILLAGLVGARRAPVIGLITAALFAISPMIVTLAIVPSFSRVTEPGPPRASPACLQFQEKVPIAVCMA